MRIKSIGGGKVTLIGRKYLLTPKTDGQGFDVHPEPDCWRADPLPWDQAARDVVADFVRMHR